MELTVDLRSKVPIYIQIVEQVKQLVATGALQPGDQLPTVRQLAADLRVNFNTVARAYRLLDEAGLISTQQGRGTYVLGTPPEPMRGRLRVAAVEGLVRSFLADAARLGLTPDEVAEMTSVMIGQWRQHGMPPSEGENAEDSH